MDVPLAQTITRQPPPLSLPLPQHHLPALFTPGLHYEVQRKSSLAIWKNLQDGDVDRVIPHPHNENFEEGMNKPKVEQMHRFRQAAFPQNILEAP